MYSLMGKFIKVSVFLIILGAITGGIYFIGERKYAQEYSAITKLLDDVLVSAKKIGGDLSLQKMNHAASEIQKFLESPLTKLMNDQYSEALLKARFNLLLSQSYYEMGLYNEDDSLTEKALQTADNTDIRNRSVLSEMELFQKEFIDKVNQYSTRYAYARADGYMQKLISIVEKKVSSQHSDGQTLKQSFPYLYSVLGKLYVNQRKWNEAKAEYEKAISMAEGIPNVGEQFYARSYWHLGFIHLKQKQYAESESLLKQALEWITNSKKPDNAILAETYHNLAEVYKAEGKTDLAEQFFNKSLEWHEKVFGAKSPKLLHVLIDYSAHLQSMGDAEKAKLLEDRGRLIETEAARSVASPQ